MPRRHLRPQATSCAEKPSLREVVRNICTRNFNIVTAVNLLVMTVYYLVFVIETCVLPLCQGRGCQQQQSDE